MKLSKIPAKTEDILFFILKLQLCTTFNFEEDFFLVGFGIDKNVL